MVFVEIKLRQLRQPGERGYVTDVVPAKIKRCKLCQSGERGDVADVVVAEA